MSIHAFVEKDGKSMQFPLLFALICLVDERRSTLRFFVPCKTGLWIHRWKWRLPISKQEHGRPSAKSSRMHPWRAAPFTGQRLFGAMYNSLACPPPLDSGKVLTASLSSSWHCHSSHGITLRMSSEWWRSEPQPLTQYVRDQWIQNPVFPIRSWSVYQFAIRTANDVEGWQHRMNSKARGLSLSFYQQVGTTEWTLRQEIYHCPSTSWSPFFRERLTLWKPGLLHRTKSATSEEPATWRSRKSQQQQTATWPRKSHLERTWRFVDPFMLLRSSDISVVVVILDGLIDSVI